MDVGLAVTQASFGHIGSIPIFPTTVRRSMVWFCGKRVTPAMGHNIANSLRDGAAW